MLVETDDDDVAEEEDDGVCVLGYPRVARAKSNGSP